LTWTVSWANEQWRGSRPADGLQARNRLSEEIGVRGRPRRARCSGVKSVGGWLLDGEVAKLEAELEAAQARIPNVPHSSVPVGHDPSANVEVRRSGSL
jgi:seryl-tRNA synthetase